MDGKVKVGIIGLGFMGSTHLGIYRGMDKARVAAVADPDPCKLNGSDSIGGNIGTGGGALDLNGVKTYADAMELIADPEIELVDICAPVFLHKQYALAALAAGKHVFCEKPLARNSADAGEIIRAAEKSGKLFMVGMCVRFWPEYFHTSQIIKSGRAGKVRVAVFKRVSPDIDGNGWENWFMKAELSGGAAFDLHLHDSDYIRELLGMPLSVCSFGAQGIRSDRGIDHIVSRYDYGDGSLVCSEGGWSAARNTPFEMSYQIVCDNITFRFSETGYQLVYADGTVKKPELDTASLPTGWHREINHLLDCLIQGKSQRECMELDGIVDSIRLVEAEIRSVESGKTISIKGA